jgi:hypothetical protein
LEMVLTATAVAVVAMTVGARLFGWSQRRCDEALAAARQLPDLSRRTFVLVATAHGGPLSRAQVRTARTVQQALDEERGDGPLLARRAVPAVSSRGDDPAER